MRAAGSGAGPAEVAPAPAVDVSPAALVLAPPRPPTSLPVSVPPLASCPPIPPRGASPEDSPLAPARLPPPPAMPAPPTSAPPEVIGRPELADAPPAVCAPPVLVWPALLPSFGPALAPLQPAMSASRRASAAPCLLELASIDPHYGTVAPSVSELILGMATGRPFAGCRRRPNVRGCRRRNHVRCRS